MDTSDALSALACAKCGGGYDVDAVQGRCPDCGGVLEPVYDLERASIETPDGTSQLGRSALLERTGLGSLFPLNSGVHVANGCGGTPLLDASDYATEIGVDGLAVKAEGCNPTGSIADREMALAVAIARSRGSETVALPTKGSGGQAAAAAAAAAGLEARAFVPSRAPFATKAMINVHGAAMTVVEGRYADARSAFESASTSESWHSLAPFDGSFRAEGVKPAAYEIAAARGWEVPDRVIVPTGHGTWIVGLHRGFRELAQLGLTEDVPRLVAAQAEGCAPLVEALETGADEPIPVEHPDTVCGPVEVPAPAGGRLALRAVEATGGTAIAVADEDVLAGAVELAATGVPTSVTGGVAVAGAKALASAGSLGTDEDVVVVDPVSPDKRADVLRSHLMSRGR